MMIELIESKIAVKYAKARKGSIGFKQLAMRAETSATVVMKMDFEALPNVTDMRTCLSFEQCLECFHASSKMKMF